MTDGGCVLIDWQNELDVEILIMSPIKMRKCNIARYSNTMRNTYTCVVTLVFNADVWINLPQLLEVGKIGRAGHDHLQRHDDWCDTTATRSVADLVNAATTSTLQQRSSPHIYICKAV